MPPLPRGTCPECGRDVALRKGRFSKLHPTLLTREHLIPDNPYGCPPCIGSGKPAKKVKP